MEEIFLVRRNSRDEHSFGSFNKAPLSQSIKQQRKSERKKDWLSYADLHHEIAASASKNHGKEHLAGKLVQEEEIIKCMSNLPAYLERGSNVQEKGLNVGVLDWGRLERWYSVQQQATCKNSLSSSFSKDHSSSPLLQSHVIPSSVVAMPRRLAVKNRVLKPLRSNTFDAKQNFIQMDKWSWGYWGFCVEPEQMKRHCLEPKVVLGRMKNGGEFIKMEDKLKASQKDITESSSIRASMESGCNNARSKVDLVESKVTVQKSRSFSPFSRLSMGLDQKIKASSSIDDSDIPHRSSARTSVQPKSENASSSDKRRSRPLRKLLDPVLKMKTGICQDARPVETDSIGNVGKSSTPMSESSTKQSLQVKLDMSRCRQIDVNQTVREKKHGPTMVQALLQAVVKNGLPLLTFAVDNVSDVLAATTKSTGLENDKTRIYTFFSIREVKKNKSWINQGGDFVSNVVAQMKASELQISSLTKREKFFAKEFSLFSVKNSDFESGNELAAIVIKLPSMPNPSSRHSTGSKTIFTTTVILPSGNHSIPNKGGPSSLIERWNSGGTCDCGGWDLGCKLRILASSSSPSDQYSLIEQLVLSSQDGEVGNGPVLRMTPVKDESFSMEFGSSVSHIQAFSIGIALLDSRNLCQLPSKKITSDKCRAAQPGRIREVAAEYASNPLPPWFDRF